jgi:8-oxo-dGTP pyrophosphatase MutT (NUDIX family)
MSAFKKFLYTLYKSQWFFTRPVTLGVRVMMLQDRQVLLLRHTYQEGWFFPGGGMQRGETVEQAARREAREEAGADLGLLRLFGLYSHFYEHKSDHIALFICEEFTLGGESDAEIAEVKFFPLSALPGGIAYGHTRRVAEYLANPHGIVTGTW